MATDGNGDPPVLDLRTMEELCQPTLNGQGGPIASIAIQATNFGLKNDMIQQVQNFYQFHGLPGDDANKHLDKFLHVTQSIKVNGVTDDALRLYLFPHSLTHHATAWFDCLPRNSITTFEKMAKMFLGKYFPPSMIDTFYNGLTLRHRDTFNAAAGGTFMKRRPEECYDIIENMTAHHNDWDTCVQRSESSSFITSFSDPEIVALKAKMAEINKNLMKPPLAKLRTYMLQEPIIKVEDLKGITTRSGNAYKGPTIPTISSPLKVVERETEVTKDTVPLTNNGSTKDVQPLVVQVENLKPNSEPVVAHVIAPVSAPKPNPKPSIPYLSRLYDQKLRDKTNDQKEKFFKIFKDLDFNISFADALILMPKFGPTIKSLLTNKEKLFELARTSLKKHCSGVLLKKLPEKLGDLGKFLIPCNFSGMDECLALPDLSASINLMPLSVWNKLSLPKLSPTCMTLELADHSISRPVRRSFLKTKRALIDVYEGELTLRVGKEFVTFTCEEYSQEVLRFSMSGNPTPSIKPIVSNSSPTLTPFEDSDFLLEETDAFLAIDDEPISSKINESYYDSEGDILFLEDFFNDDPSSPPFPPQELKAVEPTNEKSSIDEPPVVDLKDLPPPLEYAFLEGDDKLLVIIAKDLKDEEQTALIKVLKSHKQALAWKLSDIKGINLEFCTHKILMEDDFKPATPKIKKRPRSGVLMERLPTVACLLAYAMHRARSKAGSESRPPRLNKENYVPWSSRLLR
nr:reverse transcriptase domain-containing protein [Tanacetum cinerariifolium]